MAMDSPAVRGRPRSELAHQSILEAAFDLFAEVGTAGLTIQGVASRAGVAKTTVYRRWSTKEALILAALVIPESAMGSSDTGSLRGDLVGLVVSSHQALIHSRVGEVMAQIGVEVAIGSELGRMYRERIIEPRLMLVTSVLAAAQERGELRVELDPQIVHDMVLGPVFLARHSSRLPARGIVARAERIVDALLLGIAGRPGPVVCG